MNGVSITLPVTIHQASGRQLRWVDVNENDGEDLFFGSLQQQGSLMEVCPR